MSAYAQSETPDSSSEEQSEDSDKYSTAPDVVQTTDGSIFRGTVIDYAQGEFVIIRSSANGQELRFPWSKVQYVGPAGADVSESGDRSGRADANSQSPPKQPYAAETGSEQTQEERTQPPPSAESVQFVPFDGYPAIGVSAFAFRPHPETDDLAAQWTEPCVTPCTISVTDPEATLYRAGPIGGRNTSFSMEDYVSGDVAIRYQSRTGARVAVGVLGGGLMITGIALAIRGTREPDSHLIDFDGNLSNNHASRMTRLSFIPMVFGIGGIITSFLISDRVEHQYIESNRAD